MLSIAVCDDDELHRKCRFNTVFCSRRTKHLADYLFPVFFGTICA